MVLLSVHGILHLIGFINGYRLAKINQLHSIPSKTAGIAWLITAILFTIAIIQYLNKKDYWWMSALLAIILSQTLIIQHWKDARFGTIINLFLLIPLILAFAHWKFNTTYQKVMSRIHTENTQQPYIIIRSNMLHHLPAPVRHWLEVSNIVGKPITQSAILCQQGEMKTEPNGKWIPFVAEQYTTVNNPAFIWKTEIQAAPFVFISGVDKYVTGVGSMTMKIYNLFPIIQSTGPATDQGSLLRYLAEICWMPSAALNQNIQWEQIDSVSARATIQSGHTTVRGIFIFNTNGDFERFEADRYYIKGKEEPRLEKWVVTTVPGAYKLFDGVRIPYKSELTWNLKEGEYNWLRLELTDIDYNIPIK
jgi:hypothetical protein